MLTCRGGENESEAEANGESQIKYTAEIQADLRKNQAGQTALLRPPRDQHVVVQCETLCNRRLMRPIDIVLVLTVVIIWGVNFVVIKLGLQGLPPILFSALRFLFAAFPLIFFFKRPAIPWRLLVGFAAFQFAIQFPLLFIGIKLGFPPGLASLIIQLHALFTIALAVFFLGERLHQAQLIGGAIALSGMALVASQLNAGPTLIGFGLVIAAAMCWATANIFTKKIGKVEPVALVVWAAFLATPPLLLTSLIFEGFDAWQSAAAHLNWLSIGALFFQSYPNTIIGFGIWSLLMRKYPTATIAPFALLVPVTGMISATLILGEPMQWWKITAGVMVLGGLAINLFGARFLMALKSGRTINVPPDSC